MSDPGLLAIDPEAGGIDRWTFIHNLDHIKLADAANAKFPTAKLEYRILDPLPADLDDWLLDHQKSHDDLALVTKVITNDLQTVDFADQRQREAWLDLNQAEHNAFAVALGI